MQCVSAVFLLLDRIFLHLMIPQSFWSLNIHYSIEFFKWDQSGHFKLKLNWFWRRFKWLMRKKKKEKNVRLNQQRGNHSWDFRVAVVFELGLETYEEIARNYRKPDFSLENFQELMKTSDQKLTQYYLQTGEADYLQEKIASLEKDFQKSQEERPEHAFNDQYLASFNKSIHPPRNISDFGPKNSTKPACKISARFLNESPFYSSGGFIEAPNINSKPRFVYGSGGVVSFLPKRNPEGVAESPKRRKKEAEETLGLIVPGIGTPQNTQVFQQERQEGENGPQLISIGSPGPNKMGVFGLNGAQEQLREQTDSRGAPKGVTQKTITTSEGAGNFVYPKSITGDAFGGFHAVDDYHERVAMQKNIELLGGIENTVSSISAFYNEIQCFPLKTASFLFLFSVSFYFFSFHCSRGFQAVIGFLILIEIPQIPFIGEFHWKQTWRTLSSWTSIGTSRTTTREFSLTRFPRSLSFQWTYLLHHQINSSSFLLTEKSTLGFQSRNNSRITREITSSDSRHLKKCERQNSRQLKTIRKSWGSSRISANSSKANSMLHNPPFWTGNDFNSLHCPPLERQNCLNSPSKGELHWYSLKKVQRPFNFWFWTI